MSKKNYLDEKIIFSEKFSLDVKRHCNMTTFVNPFNYYFLKDNKSYLLQFDEIHIDGSLLVLLHNLFYRETKVSRKSFDFSSIADDVFTFAKSSSKTVYLIGGSNSEVIKCSENILKLYPGLNIIGCNDGFFGVNPGDKLKLFSTLKELEPDYIIIGMGAPLQEELAIELKDFGVKFERLFTCGGFITQTSLRPDYYYPLVKKLGLRWLQRFIMHSHVRRRVLINYPVFIFKYI